MPSADPGFSRVAGFSRSMWRHRVTTRPFNSGLRYARVAPRVIIGVMGLLFVGGCAGVIPTQVGQTAGTIAGSAIAPGIGAPIGALVGLLAGMVVQGEMDKVTEKHERKELSEQLAPHPSEGSAQEGTSQGEPVQVWVDETVHNGRVVPGHFDVRSLP